MKLKNIYTCTNCDAQASKWAGQCYECNKWGTLQEHVPLLETKKTTQPGRPLKTKSLTSFGEENQTRLKTNIHEIDRILGGGVVPGAVMLLAGEPGIGKSTLILHVADALTSSGSVLYISGEESGPQVASRLKRLNITNKKIEFSEHTQAENIAATIAETKPVCAIIDSIQTIQTANVDALPGSVSQVRAAGAVITQTAKQHNIPVFITGHVNKEGSIAGPKTLEHLIDALFVIEGERSDTLRILRSLKNRFGPVDEIGLFRMEETGLNEISNPSELLLEERTHTESGSVITAVMEGTRPLLVEVQALVTKTQLGYPQRRSSGFDLNRLQIITAILSKRMNLPLDSFDIFINISGGINIRERSADLAVATAIISAYHDKPVSPNIITLGEIGLAGEIRSIPHAEKRLKEAARLGFTYALIPKKHANISTELKLAPIDNISQIIDKLAHN